MKMNEDLTWHVFSDCIMSERCGFKYFLFYQITIQKQKHLLNFVFVHRALENSRGNKDKIEFLSN